MLKDLKKNMNVMEKELEDIKRNQMGYLELKILYLKRESHWVALQKMNHSEEEISELAGTAV